LKIHFCCFPAFQDYHEVKLVLRVPRIAQPRALPAAAKPSAAEPPETALGVDGIELREQTHEEALLNTIGELQARPTQRQQGPRRKLVWE